MDHWLLSSLNAFIRCSLSVPLASSLLSQCDSSLGVSGPESSTWLTGEERGMERRARAAKEDFGSNSITGESVGSSNSNVTSKRALKVLSGKSW